jgi:esterase/lipase superfamily enzyme
VKSERNKLSQASKQLQTDLDSIRCEREHALGEHEEREHALGNIAWREKITTEDQLKETTHVASRVAEQNRQLKSEVGSLQDMVAQGHQ